VNTFFFVLVNLNTGSSNNFCKHCPPWPKLSAQVKHLFPKYQIAFCCFLLNILVHWTAINTLVSSSVEMIALCSFCCLFCAWLFILFTHYLSWHFSLLFTHLIGLLPWSSGTIMLCSDWGKFRLLDFYHDIIGLLPWSSYWTCTMILWYYIICSIMIWAGNSLLTPLLGDRLTYSTDCSGLRKVQVSSVNLECGLCSSFLA
jgi:hypothetical protein